jgi:FkbM family methyltransferase
MHFAPYSSINVSKNDCSRDLLDKIVKTDVSIPLRQIDKTVALYGAGNLGRMARAFFDYFNISYSCVIDQNADRIRLEESWSDVPLLRPDEVKESVKKAELLVICIVTIPMIALQEKLRAQGWNDIVFFYDICHAYSGRYPITNGWFLHSMEPIEIDHVMNIFLSLDEISRMHYLQFLAWRRLRLELLFEGVTINPSERFFIPEITRILHEQEIFADCGAHVGDVSLRFIDILKKKYAGIHAIEADGGNYSILEKKLTTQLKCFTYNYALSDKVGEDKFYQGFNYASKLDKNGRVAVKTVTLDSLNIPATFIKMHLEGGELNALNGARRTITTNRSIAATTIYHTSDGVWKIPFFFLDTVREYRFYLRLHSWGGTGAVFYAVPRERYGS